MAIHTAFAKLATRLIDKHGRACQLQGYTETGTSYNPTRTADTPIDIKAVQTRFKLSEIDGDLIQRTDKLFLVDAQIEPTNDMRFRDGSIDYEIKNVEAVKPGETNCLYKVQCRL